MKELKTEWLFDIEDVIEFIKEQSDDLNYFLRNPNTVSKDDLESIKENKEKFDDSVKIILHTFQK